ncbi:MAG TPA: inositol monophosphatase family protein [Solirubrobacteraceae bacterium]|jgi:myo-inositol-1(or 4)-monophosphatase|nr:inositol monophosphatase family protein [Solirubrobacteraceae bacterium]
MDAVSAAIEADWLGACRRASRRLAAMLAATSGIAERARETGSRGSGGDRTLIIDEAAESIVLEELDRLHAAGHQFSAISEERGEIDFGDSAVRVVIDPIDGSLNAKRGLPHHAVSIAVATGNTMADVEFGYVFDFGPQEEWWARRGEGAWLNGEQLDPDLQERRGRDGRLEVLGIESADPRWVKASIDELGVVAYRLRALGAIAPALCQVAASRLDGLVSLHNCRAVDAAAGQLIVRESGGVVSFPRCSAPLSAPLDTEPRSPVVAARSPETLHELERVPDLG